MAKITIHKKVFWTAAGRQMEGKVKQILSDHAVVTANGSDYLVRKASLSVMPVQKTASTSKIIVTADAEVKYKIPSSVRNMVSKIISSLTTNKYYQHIPLNEISEALTPLAIEMEKDFLLTGADGRTTLDLTYQGQPVVNMLAIQWHKMEVSGKYEVNAYLT